MMRTKRPAVTGRVLRAAGQKSLIFMAHTAKSSEWHVLLSVDATQRNGVCSICGEVPVRLKNTGGWRCSFADRGCLKAADKRRARLSGSSTVERFLSKIRPHANGCWLWQSAINKQTGYGAFYAFGKSVSAHRFSYGLFIGAIPEDLCLDHLCRNRKCVNPMHLEAVTNAENSKRGVWKPKGHALLLVNATTRTGICYTCGEVKIRKRGDSWRCSIAGR